jgi:hypothetical protein
MANIIIGHTNLIDTATVAGGSWNASYPLANVKDSRLALAARTTGITTASTLMTVDLGSAKQIRVVGIVNHNLTLLATVVVEGSTSSSFSPVGVTSGSVRAYPVGAVAADMGYPRPTLGVAVNGTYRYWRISISDLTNTAGYISIGRIFIGEGFQPTINMANGASLGFEGTTGVVTSLSGAEFYAPKPIRRVMRFALPNLPHNEGYGAGLETIRRSADYREVFVIPDADDTANRTRRDFMGRLRQLSAIEQPFAGSATLGFEVAELL